MSEVKWTKVYDLHIQDKHKTFRVFTSEDDNGYFHAGCLWYERERALGTSGHSGDIRFALETRVDTIERAALDELMKWVKAKFGENIDLVPSS